MDNSTEQLSAHLQEQAEKLKRATSGIVPEHGLEEKLLTAEKEKRPLRIKLGLDPTAPDIHLGFAVALRKLRQFQDLGHIVVIIIGDYTALIGDPSGRSVTRPMLSPELISDNARTYIDQLSRILDRTKTEVRFNSEWLGKLNFADIVSLSSKMTVAQILQREDFSNRYSAHQPIGLHELLYPLAQAYDSVAIHADIEIGGLDQTFNILAGRDLQRELGQPPQIALFMPLLVGLDGVKKMSKSLGNYVGIAETPLEMFGKLMSISDSIMKDYFLLCTDVGAAEIELLLKQSESGEMNPKRLKQRLAREIISLYHGTTEAENADTEWNRIHAAGETPSEIPIAVISEDMIRDGTLWICRLLTAAGMAASNKEARRLVDQGGVEINGKRITDSMSELEASSLDNSVLKVGSRRYARLQFDCMISKLER